MLASARCSVEAEADEHKSPPAMKKPTVSRVFFQEPPLFHLITGIRRRARRTSISLVRGL
jgi:hypothetical protein|tara:strand:- start:3738 stop:3917 length:180 start_codon:yes stop_codon:yes gene_type:complete